MICRTPEDAYRAGYEQPCDHGHPVSECDDCRLTPTEITRIAALLRPHLAEHTTAA